MEAKPVAGYLYYFDNFYDVDHIAEVVFYIRLDEGIIENIYFSRQLDYDQFIIFPEARMHFTNANLIDRKGHFHKVRELHLETVRGQMIQKIGKVVDNIGNNQEQFMTYWTASVRRIAENL